MYSMTDLHLHLALSLESSSLKAALIQSLLARQDELTPSQKDQLTLALLEQLEAA